MSLTTITVPETNWEDATLHMPVKDRYAARELLPSEWNRIKDFEYFATGGLPPNDGHTKIFVSEYLPTGAIAWVWMVKEVILLEGFAVAPAHRRSLRAGMRLIQHVKEFLTSHHVRYPLTITTTDNLAQMTEKLGFQPIHGGVLHLWNLTED